MAALRVLVIEDDARAAENERMLLTAMGCTTHSCPTGDQGVRVALAWRPDAILCDLGLPGMDGYEVARTLRQSLGGESPLLVAVTGESGAAEQERALYAGFERVFTKPASWDEVMEYVLRRRLGKASHESASALAS